MATGELQLPVRGEKIGDFHYKYDMVLIGDKT